MSEHIHKSHNKSLLLYHFICPVKYRRKVLTDEVSVTFKEIFWLHPEVKQILWGGRFWVSGYYVNTVGQYANKEVETVARKLGYFS